MAFQPRSETLIVSFDNMTSREMPGQRYPWGWGFVRDHGWSHLGVCMARRNDWFRHRDLFDFFDEMKDTGFFKRFKRVVFYGSSMGGYGALAFAAAAPGAHVVAFVPQTALRPDLAPFETRYRTPFGRGDWQDPRYVDGMAGAETAASVTVFYDPYYSLDRQHVDRLPKHNLLALKAPFMEHRVPRVLLQMGQLQGVATAALTGELTETTFSAAIRSRLAYRSYLRMLFNRALEKNHHALVAAAVSRYEEKHGLRMAKYARLSRRAA